MTFPITETAENLWCEQVTIPAGSNVAEPITTQGRALVAIQMPSAWTAANIGFEASIDGKTFQTAYDNTGALEQATVDASRFVAFPSSDAIFAPYLKIKSVDGTNAAVNQAADRVLSVLFRRFLGGK